MREVTEIDWVTRRATLEFYISSFDTDHEHVITKVMSSCDEAFQKMGRPQDVDIFLLNTGEGSRTLVTMIMEKGKDKGYNINAIGF